MKSLLIALASILIGSQAHGEMVFEYPPDPDGGIGHSSWFPPDGSDNDIFSYEKFLLASDASITEVRWRGGYQPSGFGQLTDFTVTFFASTAPNGFYPDCGLPGESEVYLARYQVGGLAGQTFVGSFGGVSMYDYDFTLPQPFQATAGVTYWIRIEGETAGQPFWGVANGTGGNGSHIEFATGTGMFLSWPHDLAFSLHTAAATSVGDPGAGLSSALTVVPNPFAGRTTVGFSMVRSGPATVTVHDLQGRLVRSLTNDAPYGPGPQFLGWDGRDSKGNWAASGVYICRIVADGRVQSARMNLLRGH